MLQLWTIVTLTWRQWGSACYVQVFRSFGAVGSYHVSSLQTALVLSSSTYMEWYQSIHQLWRTWKTTRLGSFAFGQNEFWKACGVSLTNEGEVDVHPPDRAFRHPISNLRMVANADTQGLFLDRVKLPSCLGRALFLKTIKLNKKEATQPFRQKAKHKRTNKAKQQ